MASGDARLQVDVGQRFAGGFHLEASLDVTVGAGSVLVLFGPSGAGKTTLLRLIAGLERPERGSIRFDEDTWIDVESRRWVAPQGRGIGLVFQQPTLFPHLTVSANVRYGVASESSVSDTYMSRLKVVPVSDTYMNRLNGPVVSDTYMGRLKGVEEIEVMLGISNLGKRYPRSLSGGEAQRVAVARALATGPRLLLLDEPFAALDAPTRVRLRGDVRALLQRTGTPAILVTHDRGEALAFGDRIAVMIGGRIRQTGDVATVFTHPVDADVAASLGVEAVLPATVRAVSDGVATVDVGAPAIALHAVERDPLTVGSPVYACIRAEDVTIETQSSPHASARNHLAARVAAITREGPLDRVALDCGFALDALITRRSREELALAVGDRVIASIKATSIHLVPRE